MALTTGPRGRGSNDYIYLCLGCEVTCEKGSEADVDVGQGEGCDWNRRDILKILHLLVDVIKGLRKVSPLFNVCGKEPQLKGLWDIRNCTTISHQICSRNRRVGRSTALINLLISAQDL